MVPRVARPVAPEGVLTRLGAAAEPVPDAGDGRQADVLQLDDLLLAGRGVTMLQSVKLS